MDNDLVRIVDRNEEPTKVMVRVGNEWKTVAENISRAAAAQIADTLNSALSQYATLVEALWNLSCCSCTHTLKSHTATGVAAEAGFPCVEQSRVADMYTEEEGKYCRCTRGTFNHEDLLAALNSAPTSNTSQSGSYFRFVGV